MYVRRGTTNGFSQRVAHIHQPVVAKHRATHHAVHGRHDVLRRVEHSQASIDVHILSRSGGWDAFIRIPVST